MPTRHVVQLVVTVVQVRQDGLHGTHVAVVVFNKVPLGQVLTQSPFRLYVELAVVQERQLVGAFTQVRHGEVQAVQELKFWKVPVGQVATQVPLVKKVFGGQAVQIEADEHVAQEELHCWQVVALTKVPTGQVKKHLPVKR
jgi:hypothetical protein